VRVTMVRRGLLKNGNVQNGTKIMLKRVLTPPLNLLTMVGMMVQPVRKWRSSLKRVPKTSKIIRGLDYQMRPKAWKVVMLD
jgi:hypothetical protein